MKNKTKPFSFLHRGKVRDLYDAGAGRHLLIVASDRISAFDHVLLNEFAAGFARERDIIIADTKFEFGLLDGELILIDELFTPDSSRFWPIDTYTPGVTPPPSFDKQFVRDYLNEINWNKQLPVTRLLVEGVDIPAAGKAAHLAGVLSSLTTLPVFGVPMTTSDLGGLDSLLSTVQMPAGIPVGTFAIGKAGAKNAALLAVAVLALSDNRLREKLKGVRKKMRDQVEADDADISQAGLQVM